MKRTLIILFFFFSLVLIGANFSPIVFAQDRGATTTPTAPAPGQTVEELRAAAQTLNKLQLKSPIDLVSRLVAFFMGAVGSFALIMYIWAGFMWMIAQGNAEKIDLSKRLFIWTSLALVVMFGSGIIVTFLFTALK